MLFGGSAVIVDPKSERGNWKETLPEIAQEINIVNLTSEAKNKGLLDPYVIMKNLKDAESLAIEGAFEELLDVKDQCKYAQELDSTGAVLAKVGSTPGAIGYVSLDVLDDTVTAMKIDGVEATEENIVAGKYLLSRPFVMATKGKIDEQNDIVKAWFDYVNSDEGQAVIKKVGLILPQ